VAHLSIRIWFDLDLTGAALFAFFAKGAQRILHRYVHEPVQSTVQLARCIEAGDDKWRKWRAQGDDFRTFLANFLADLTRPGTSALTTFMP
jgi:hypothetical protein